MKTNFLTLCALACVAMAQDAQVRMTDTDPSFAVATIKPSDPNRPGRGIGYRGQDLTTVNTTVVDLVVIVYGVHLKQIENMPTWMNTEKFDITARPEATGMATESQLRTMMKKLLAERFQLKFHTAAREMNAYVLTMAKTGPKLTRNTTSQSEVPGARNGGPGQVRFTNSDMAFLVNRLQANVLDRPVVDKTGLTGRYDFTLTWTPDEFQTPGPAGPAPKVNGADAPSLFVAMEEQLGLRLESGKAQVDVMVIDTLEKPSEN